MKLPCCLTAAAGAAEAGNGMEVQVAFVEMMGAQAAEEEEPG